MPKIDATKHAPLPVPPPLSLPLRTLLLTTINTLFYAAFFLLGCFAMLYSAVNAACALTRCMHLPRQPC